MEERRRILPADKTYSTSLKEPVRILPIELNTIPPRSVPYMFDEVCRQHSGRTALNYKKNGEWVKISFWEYRAMVRNCAKAFITLGLQPNTVVCILGFNSPEWFVADLGAIYAGGVAAGIYTTNSAEACLYCLNNSNAKILVVEYTQLSKILGIRRQATSVRAIIQYGGEDNGQQDVIVWDKFMRMGEAVSDTVLENARKGIHVNQCCTLVYTSGTTGNPKGAMLSHDNVVYDALKIGEKLSLTHNEVYVSYLPLSHVAGNIVDIHCGYLFTVKVYFADKDALRGSLLNTFQEVRPTRILSVPRVWEKIYEKFQEKAAETTGIAKIISSWAKKQGLRKNLALERNEVGSMYPLMYHLANIIVFRRIKKLLGIDNCKTIISGAAPLSTEVKLYFASLDILILEAYGMSESSSLHCSCVENSFKFDSCGTSCTGMITYIDSPDEEGNGELCLYGRHIFMGYLNEKEKTLETLDDRGYLHSGDVAKIDEEGFIYITGRIKELIITAGGENVAPVLIEQNIKAQLPCVGHAMVVGDRKKFLIVLLTFAAEVDENQYPTPQLTRRVQTWLASIGMNFTTMTEVIKSGPHKKILDAIQEGIDKANEKAISNAQRVQKFGIIPQDFSIPGGELGPTMKLKRKFIESKYQDIIDEVYEQTTRS